MKKKIILPILLSAAAITLLFGCADKGSTSSVAREKVNTNNVTIIDETVPLAGTIAKEYNDMCIAVFHEVNRYRRENGLKDLQWSDGLFSASLIRAEELTTKWSHQRPDGSDWYTVNPDLVFGENLAQGYSAPEAVVKAWMDSPEHRKNILDSGYNTCAIGICIRGDNYYWAQEFGY